MTVREFLTAERKWTQGAFARDRNGLAVAASDPRAVRWCLKGAIQRADRDGATWPLVAAWIRHTKRSLSEWNDVPGRTFAEVRALILELDL